MDLDGLVRRDGGRCWVCGGEVDSAVPRTAPGAPTVDHVLPRALGGGNEPANLRLAHQRCNGRRGSELPELAWPPDLPVLHAAPVWPVARRALRRPGEWEVVAVLPTEEVAAAAGRWLTGALPLVLGPGWECRSGSRDDRGGAPYLLSLRAAPLPEQAPHRGSRRRVRRRPR